MSVNYDKVVTADGRQWLSYVTASGNRRYVDIAAAKAEAKPETKPVAKPANNPSSPRDQALIPSQVVRQLRQKLRFQVQSWPTMTRYGVNFTIKVLTADGRHAKLSYVTTSGNRRYVDIAVAKTEVSQPAAKTKSPRIRSLYLHRSCVNQGA